MTNAQHQTLLPAGQAIRLSGRNLTETDEVKLGAYHTLELEPQRAFTLAKVCSGVSLVARTYLWANTGSLGHLGGDNATCIVIRELLESPDGARGG